MKYCFENFPQFHEILKLSNTKFSTHISSYATATEVVENMPLLRPTSLLVIVRYQLVYTRIYYNLYWEMLANV